LSFWLTAVVEGIGFTSGGLLESKERLQYRRIFSSFVLLFSVGTDCIGSEGDRAAVWEFV
jgi:hypothetical protein